MTWVAWRVQRLQYLTAAGAVLIIGLWLMFSGLYGDSSWSQAALTGDIFVLSGLPGLLGLTLGTSLVAGEFHNKTNRLAWSQSVSRSRWLVDKLATGTVVVGVLSAALVPLLDWWGGAMNVGVDIQPKIFDITGVVVVGYTLFAFMLGAALGAIIQKPTWAFAASVPVFALVRLLIGGQRSTLASPFSLVEPIQGVQPNGWILHYGYLPLGQTSPASGQSWTRYGQHLYACFNRVLTSANQTHCALVAHLHWVWQYEPERHYWSIQWSEATIYLGLAIVLLVVTLITVRRWET